jgi:two-component system, sensor histidine kinase and response regulator
MAEKGLTAQGNHSVDRMGKQMLNEERYLRILGGINDGYFENDLKGCLTFFNDALCTITGYSREELIGMNYRQYTDRTNADKIYQAYHRLYRTGEPVKNLQYKIIEKNGTIAYLEASATLMKDAGGNVTGFYGICRDVTERVHIEEALRESKERYHSIINSIPDGYFEVDLRGNMTFFNDALCGFMGYSRKEMRGISNRKLMDEASAEKVFAVFNKVYTTGEPGIVEYDALRKDGGMKRIECRTSVIKDRDDRVVGFRGVARDVTERRKAEEALRRSEERYRTILGSIEDSYFESDLNGNLTFTNDAAAKVWGYPKKELIGMNYRQYTDKENAAKLRAAFHRVYQTGKPERSIEYDLITRNGTVRCAESSSSPIKDSQGNVVGFRGITRDVTERKRAEMELQRAKEAAEEATRAKSEFLANMSHEIRTPMNGILGMYNLLLGTALDDEQADYVATGKRSADGLLTVINDILDFSKIEAGKLDLEVLDFDLRKAMEEVVELPAVQAHQKGLEFAYQIHADIPSLLRGDPGRLRQIITNLCSNAIKFTQQGEVVIRVTPEQETPTHIKIRFAVQDSGIGISAADQQRLFRSFHQVDASTTRKYGGTGLGLAISKKLAEIMGGEIGLESRPCAGSTFWFTAHFEKQPQVREKALLLPENIRNKRFLIVDDNKTNLDILAAYLNAWGCICDVARNAEMALSMMHAVRKVQAPFDLVIIDMRMPEVDGAELGRRIKNDPGLRDTRIIMLTSQGIRGDAARVKAIGFAAYLTKPIRRSLLFDCLTTVLGESGQAVRAEKPPLVTRHSLYDDKIRRTRILLAEDNAVNRKLALHLLGKFGFQADAVANGLEALRALELAPYDIILMDVQMPEMDGLEATQAIRDPRSSVRNHQVPIIAMTAHAMQGDREMCLKAGMDDYVSKPIQPEELFTALQRQMAGNTEGAGTPDQHQPPS